MPETTPLIKAALNLRGGAGFDVYVYHYIPCVFYLVVLQFWKSSVKRLEIYEKKIN